jgi:16S rRNA (cytosine967-C5)-methyltransferase
VCGEYPRWLEPELLRSFGPDLPDEMQAMNARASVDPRVNTLRAARDDMLLGLRSLGVEAEPTRFSPVGLRIASAEGLGGLQHTQLFQTGAFEFQDEASQLVTQLCGVRAGQTVLDFAAGAGGKSLALAALMHDRGEILAYDVDARRLKQLSPRARRAGTTIVRTADRRDESWTTRDFDLVLVDAPCSGSGTWRRNPELKWRLTPERLQALVQLQSRLIRDGARHTTPGGRLVYVTCSLLTSEGEDICSQFLERAREFRLVRAEAAWKDAGLPMPPPAQAVGDFFRATPRRMATDGFFACIIERAG